MRSPLMIHPDEETLFCYADGELDPVGMAAVDEHLLGCNACRDRLYEIQEGLKVASAYHAAHKRSLPPPPNKWADLWSELGGAGAEGIPQPVRKRAFSAWWAAAAAAAVAGIVLFTLTRPETVSAAELLDRAILREREAGPPRMIRIKTRDLLYVRPSRSADRRARPTASEAEADERLRARLRAAKFDWDEPLSAASYSSWRDQLTQKEDAVIVLKQSEAAGGPAYRIETRTPLGDLAEVALTLRASDLRAVHEVFRFRDNDTVEISDAGDVPEPPAEPAPAAPGPAAPASALSVADELRVVAALHNLGADLGEPIELERDEAAGKLEVRAVGIDEGRQKQLMAALSRLPNVVVEFESPVPVSSGTTAEVLTETVRRPDALQKRLEAFFGGSALLEQYVNEMLERSEANLARAHALENLAIRFSSERESKLSGDEKATLRSIVRNHVAAIQNGAAEFASRLEPLIGAEAAAVPAGCASWQACAHQFLRATQQLDSALTRALAPSEPLANPEDAVDGVRGSFGRWKGGLAAWEPVLREK